MKLRLALLALAVLTLLSCGGIKNVQNEDLSDLKASALAYLDDATLSWSSGIKAPEFSSTDKVSRWKDTAGLGFSLLPPMTSNGGSDLNRAPQKLEESKYFISFGVDQHLAPIFGDFSAIVSDSYYVQIVVRNLTLATDATKTLRLFELFPADGSKTGHIGAQISPSKDANTSSCSITFFGWYDADNHSLRESTIKDCLGSSEILVLGLQVPRDTKQMSVFLNGKRIQAQVTEKGNPPYMGLVARQLAIHALSGYGKGGNFELAELAFWTKELSEKEIKVKNELAHEIWQTLSETDKPVEPTPTPEPSPTPDDTAITFAKVKAILQNYNSSNGCLQCHDTKLASHAALTGGTLDSTSGKSLWVQTGNGSASLLVEALEGNGAKKMPMSGSGPSSGDIQKIKTWIDQGAKP